MPAIESRPLPDHALLARYARAGCYTDCFCTEVKGSISCADYVEAFYTTPLFKAERLILTLAVASPSTDTQARQVATGTIDRFAAWQLEARTDQQLLMCDIFGSTRSWFMVEPVTVGGSPRTRLYFGSAVTKTAMNRRTFRWLTGFHVLYSKALLNAARRRIGSEHR
jgi:hypothetical protein